MSEKYSCLPIEKAVYDETKDVTTFYTASGTQIQIKGNYETKPKKLKIVYEEVSIDETTT